jgi:diguanylate cyclase (GGDEF)-like protein
MLAGRIIALLEEGPEGPEGWRSRLARLERRFGRDVYAVLLFVLTHLEFPPDKAHEHWGRVLVQWEELRRVLGSSVDLRVAVLHYFLRIQRRLRNPAIVEIKILRQTQSSALHDGLTRLYNFRYFEDRLKAEVRRSDRYDSPLALLMVDVDDFKAFNDSRGHLAGNVALRQLASVLRRSVREADVVARYGGEEFAILLPNTSKLAALHVAEKVRRAVEKARIGASDDTAGRGLTVSIGVSGQPGDACAAKELADRADRGLYVAKSLGKNCTKPFSDERRESARLDASLEGCFSLVEDKSHAFTTLNLSEGGLLFLAGRPLAMGTMVRVYLDLPGGSEPIEGVARVVRVAEGKGGYEIGTRFVHIPRLHQRRLRFFLKELRAERSDREKPAPRPTAARLHQTAPA